MALCEGCRLGLDNNGAADPPTYVLTEKQVGKEPLVMQFHREDCLVKWAHDQFDETIGVSCPIHHPHCIKELGSA